MKAKAVEKSDLRPFSSIVLDGDSRAPSRAMLYPVGFTKDDFSTSLRSASLRPGAWSRRATCTSINWRGEAAQGVDDAGGKATIFNTITISDGISMGTEGMKYSSGVARSDRRLDRNRCRLRRVRRRCGDWRMRQKHARLLHRYGAAEPARRLCLRRNDFSQAVLTRAVTVGSRLGF